MKLTQSIFILIMVGWGMVLSAADTPQVDPKTLDVGSKGLHKQEGAVR